MLRMEPCRQMDRGLAMLMARRIMVPNVDMHSTRVSNEAKTEM